MKLHISRQGLGFRINWKYAAIGLAVLPFVAVLVAWIGFFNVGASSGHWRITEWFLHFAMRSAVRTYATTIEVPETFDEGAVLPAAGHFATGCAVCHGAPGEERPAMTTDMLPEPPRLEEVIADWNDAELFRIVKHGVRFTGMPAWPTQKRDDEVWAMVAFLRELPGLEPQEYRDLAYGSADAAEPEGADPRFEATLAECARCHGGDGLGRSEAVPVIAGQRPGYLVESLKAYAAEERESGIMELATTEADDALWEQLAAHYASLPARGPASDRPEAQLIERGEAIARQGIPGRKIPACLGCHEGPDRNPVYPSLDGQKPSYLENQLRLFASGGRGGTPYSHLMTEFASRLEPAERRSVAAYFANRRGREGD